MARSTIKLLVIGLTLVVVSEAYPKGAPSSVCDSMTPSHGVDAQTSEFPYSLSTTKKGNQIVIAIKPKAATDSFKGFIVEVRDNTDKPIGSFSTQANVTKSIDCSPGKKNALTHTNPEPKKEIKATWTAPSGFSGPVHVIATVARDGAVFWVGHKSTNLNIGPDARRH